MFIVLKHGLNIKMNNIMCHTKLLLSIYQRLLLKKLMSVKVERNIYFKIFTKFISNNVSPKTLTSVIYYKYTLQLSNHKMVYIITPDSVSIKDFCR